MTNKPYADEFKIGAVRQITGRGHSVLIFPSDRMFQLTVFMPGLRNLALMRMRTGGFGQLSRLATDEYYMATS